jgi:hypothetical protein
VQKAEEDANVRSMALNLNVNMRLDARHTPLCFAIRLVQIKVLVHAPCRSVRLYSSILLILILVMLIERTTPRRNGVGSYAHAKGDDSVEGRAVAEPVAAEANGVPFAVVIARVLAHVVVQPFVQLDEHARGLRHDRRLDDDSNSIPVAVRVHQGDGRARTLLAEPPPPGMKHQRWLH